MRRVLRVLGPERGDRLSVLVALVRLRFQERRAAVQPDPTQLRPVLVPAVGEHDRVGQDQQVPNAGELPWIRRGLGLLVDGAVEPGPAESVVHLAEDVADRHEPRAALRVHCGQDGASLRLDEPALGVRENRLAWHVRMMHGSAMRPARAGAAFLHALLAASVGAGWFTAWFPALDENGFAIEASAAYGAKVGEVRW